MVDEKMVGFWASRSEPELPVPEPDVFVDDDRRRLFLKALQSLESVLEAELYRGFSLCRICGCGNGSGEYAHKGWRWPDGLSHYVDDHLVMPDSAFVDHVINTYYSKAIDDRLVLIVLEEDECLKLTPMRYTVSISGGESVVPIFEAATPVDGTSAIVVFKDNGWVPYSVVFSVTELLMLAKEETGLKEHIIVSSEWENAVHRHHFHNYPVKEFTYTNKYGIEL